MAACSREKGRCWPVVSGHSVCMKCWTKRLLIAGGDPGEAFSTIAGMRKRTETTQPICVLDLAKLSEKLPKLGRKVLRPLASSPQVGKSPLASNGCEIHR